MTANRLICLIFGHEWTPEEVLRNVHRRMPRGNYRGLPRTLMQWRCDRCGTERKTHIAMKPTA